MPNPALNRAAHPRCGWVPSALRDGELELHLVRVLNVSPLGARLMHLELWHAGVVCHVDLPLALGALRLTGRVVWARLHGTEQTVEGERRCYYDSGIEFTGLTPEQQTAGVPSPLPPHVTGAHDSGSRHHGVNSPKRFCRRPRPRRGRAIARSRLGCRRTLPWSANRT